MTDAPMHCEKIMQIPTFIQERVPQFWLLLGLLFLATGAYLGFEYPLTFLYFAVGVVCIFWSFCTVVLRPRKPEYTWTEPGSVVDRSASSDEEEPLKQSVAQPMIEPIVDVSDLPELPPEPITDPLDEDS